MPSFLQESIQAFKEGNIIAIDESGFDQRPAATYGYARKGSPAIVKWRPSSDRRRLNLLMAIHASGSSASVMKAEPINGSTFASFIRALPYPPGTKVLMDNAAFHKTVDVKRAMQHKGYAPCYVPPYSPEFNPIELVFGIIKNAFYRLRYSESYDELESAVTDCILAKTTASAVRNCFRHVQELLEKEDAKN